MKGVNKKNYLIDFELIILGGKKMNLYCTLIQN
jgi:hypothetical protein